MQQGITVTATQVQEFYCTTTVTSERGSIIKSNDALKTEPLEVLIRQKHPIKLTLLVSRREITSNKANKQDDLSFRLLCCTFDSILQHHHSFTAGRIKIKKKTLVRGFPGRLGGSADLSFLPVASQRSYMCMMQTSQCQ